MSMVRSLILTKRNIRSYLVALAEVAAHNGVRRAPLMIYGGGALLLASNFREKTSDIDAFIGVDNPAPVRENRELQTQAMFLHNLAEIVLPKAENGGEKWFDPNIYMVFEHSPINLATREHHIYLESQSAENPAFDIYVPDKSLLLAMKTKAMRLEKRPDRDQPKDLDDLLNLLTLHPEIKNDQQLIMHTAKYFPDIQRNGNEHVFRGATELFTTYRDRPRHAKPFYAKGSNPEP